MSRAVIVEDPIGEAVMLESLPPMPQGRYRIRG